MQPDTRLYSVISDFWITWVYHSLKSLLLATVMPSTDFSSFSSSSLASISFFLFTSHFKLTFISISKNKVLLALKIKWNLFFRLQKVLPRFFIQVFTRAYLVLNNPPKPMIRNMAVYQ